MNESDVTICMDESRKGGSSFIVIYVHFHGRRAAGIQRCGARSAEASKARKEIVARIVHDCSRESESIDGE